MDCKRFVRNHRAKKFLAGRNLTTVFAMGLTLLFVVQPFFLAERAVAINIVMDFQSGSSDFPDFDPDGSRLIALMGAVETYYQDIFEESNHTLTVEFYYDELDGGTLAVHRNLGTSGGQPTKCRIRVDSDRNWFIDDTPFDNSEFNMQQTLYENLSSTQQTNWFDGTPPDLLEVTYKGKALSTAPYEARSYTDMFSVVLHEMGHGLGMTGNCASGDTGDYDYDFANVLAWDHDMAAKCYATDNRYHIAADALMDPYASSGWRHLPSMTDILSMQDAGEWNTDYIDLPRQDFYNSNASADFNDRTNWSGNQTPGNTDEVHVRHGGTAALSTNDIVGSLTIEGASTVDLINHVLTVSDTATVGTSSTKTGTLNIGAGKLTAGNLSVGNSSTVLLGGGVLDIDSGTINYNGAISGNGTIQVTEDFQVGGVLESIGGNLTIQKASGQSPTIDLDMSSSAQIIADGGDITFSLAVSDPVASSIFINPGRSVAFDHLWTLESAGRIYLTSNSSSTARLTGVQATINGKVYVAGNSAKIDCPVILGNTAEVTFTTPTDMLEFLQETIYLGASIEADGIIQQTANVTINAATTINVDTFDMDGRHEGSIFTINSPLSIVAQQIELPLSGNDAFNGTIRIDNAGHLNIIGIPSWNLAGSIAVLPTNTAMTAISGSPISILNTGYIYLSTSTNIGTPLNIQGMLMVDGSENQVEIAQYFGYDSTISGGTIMGSGTLSFSQNGLSGYGTISAKTQFNGTNLTATGGTLTITKPVQGVMALSVNQGTLNFAIPWNTSSTFAIQLNEGEITGETIYNDNFSFSGNGTVSAASFTNASRITVSGGDLIFDTAGPCLLDDNDGNPGSVTVSDGNLHVKTNQAITPFDSALTVSNSHELRMDYGGLHVMPTNGTVTLTQGSFVMPTLVQAGTLQVNAGDSVIDAETVTFVSSSQNQIDGTLTLSSNTEIMAGAAFSGTGELVNGSGAAMTCQNGAVVGVNMSIADQFNLDDDLGELTVNADVQLETTAEFHMDLGLDNMLQLASDHMTITGMADLGGATLVLNLLDGFEPTVGDQFDLFDWGTTVTGIFADVIAPEGYAFDLSNLYSDGLIAVSLSPNLLPGDANGDGFVDGSDVTILANNWQYGTTGTADATWEMGDFNADGKVDGSDVTILANNWQMGIPTAAAVVPEPSSMAMILLLTAFGLLQCWRKMNRARVTSYKW